MKSQMTINDWYHAHRYLLPSMLKSFRWTRDLTVQEMADKLGMFPSTLLAIERSTWPTIQTLEDYAAAFELSLSDFCQVLVSEYQLEIEH